MLYMQYIQYIPIYPIYCLVVSYHRAVFRSISFHFVLFPLIVFLFPTTSYYFLLFHTISYYFLLFRPTISHYFLLCRQSLVPQKGPHGIMNTYKYLWTFQKRPMSVFGVTFLVVPILSFSAWLMSCMVYFWFFEQRDHTEKDQIGTTLHLLIRPPF